MRKDRQTHRLKTFENYITKTGGIKKAWWELTDKKEWVPKMKNNIGKCLTRRPDILATATDFYHDLYSRKNNIKETDLTGNYNVPEILPSEVGKTIETQKRDKAPGPDKISNEFLIAS
ncbi:Endonuclease-reverse transcriptase [Operophtera brumata]|uniref:Endonuclease-reverse transcriptase n=1 Tax=Operophtera brumata TaxID=104452 RepID=A0A0L7L2K2_OPEBR|nr:Endonuclease-reverse transcriptase [Operophtera brumata]